MKRLRCYLYREGRDFTLPEAFTGMSLNRPEAAECVVELPGGGHAPLPEYFERVSPDEAEVFLFPYDLGPILNCLFAEKTADFLRGLPYMKGREGRHVFSDNGDFPACILLPVLLFKRSLLKHADEDRGQVTSLARLQDHPNAPSVFITWYRLPDHVAADKPDFNPDHIRYDCSFVGGYSNIIRNMAVKSLERQEDIRFYNGGFENMRLEGNSFHFLPQTPEESAERREIFRKVTKASLTVLCPPGVGPQSFRLYETMYYGRIPVLFTRKICYPYEDRIDYDAFCLFIEEGDISRAGQVLRRRLDEHSPEALWNKCVLACRTWNAWFHNRDRAARLTDGIRDHVTRLNAR